MPHNLNDKNKETPTKGWARTAMAILLLEKPAGGFAYSNITRGQPHHLGACRDRDYLDQTILFLYFFSQ